MPRRQPVCSWPSLHVELSSVKLLGFTPPLPALLPPSPGRRPTLRDRLGPKVAEPGPEPVESNPRRQLQKGPQTLTSAGPSWSRRCPSAPGPVSSAPPRPPGCWLEAPSLVFLPRRTETGSWLCVQLLPERTTGERMLLRTEGPARHCPQPWSPAWAAARLCCRTPVMSEDREDSG